MKTLMALMPHAAAAVAVLGMFLDQWDVAAAMYAAAAYFAVTGDQS